MILPLLLLLLTSLVATKDVADDVAEDVTTKDVAEDDPEEWDPIDPDIEAVEECEDMIDAMYKKENVIADDNLAVVALANATAVLETGDCGDLNYCRYINNYKYGKLTRGCDRLLNQVEPDEDVRIMLVGCGFAARAGKGGAIVCVDKEVAYLKETVSDVCNRYISSLYSKSTNIVRDMSLELKAAQESENLLREKKCTLVDATRCRYMRNIDSFHYGKDECAYFVEGINPKKKKKVGCSFVNPGRNGAITCVMESY